MSSVASPKPASCHRRMLEITESVFLEAGPRLAHTLGRSRTLSIRLSLDDFGTGYSSLRYLQQFLIDQLKIDHSFVSGTCGGLASGPIVRTIVVVANTLGLEVVAEGIESDVQCTQLLGLGCRLGQGFHFAPPRAPGDSIDARAGGPLVVERGRVR
jgi:EAL domain-containing protein (putative c-di-GMP-specific phosphodiesterase class I)